MRAGSAARRLAVPRRPPDDEHELITTAAKGALRVLRAYAPVRTVRRVVLTSSITAITHGHADDTLRTEADWAVVERSPAYQESKTLAWEFAESCQPTADSSWW
jgi:dihydroflavonol-4-reductase